MPTIKLPKTEDIAQVIQRIKTLKDREVVFELEKGSVLLDNSNNLKLMKKTGEVMGKKIWISTDDDMGKILARKAEVLYGEEVAPKVVRPMPRVKRSDVKPRFSDIMGPKRAPMMTAHRPVSFPKAISSAMPIPDLTRVKAAAPKLRVSWPKLSFKASFSKIFILCMIVLVLGAFALAVLLPQAAITVYARSEPVTRDIEITVDKNARTIDAGKLVIPGSVVSREASLTKTFPATGTKQTGTKAVGEVTIYNFTKNTLTLRAGTTVLVAGDKRFVFTKDATNIRPTARIGSGDEQEIDQSSLTPPVPVTAEVIGDSSNLPANTQFEIRNSALGNNPNVYAVNATALTGGTQKNITVVSQADIDKATAELTESLASQAEADLNAEANAGTTTKLLPSAVTHEVLGKAASRNPNDEATNFDMTIIGKVTGLTYQQEDVENIALDKINSVLSEDKYLLPEAKKDVTAKFKNLDLAAGKGTMSVHFETIAAYRVNDANLTKILAGKNANEIKEILLMKPEIDRVDVEFSPFFVNKAPRFNGKIYIETKLSEL
jgi:hypothetical protein